MAGGREERLHLMEKLHVSVAGCRPPEYHKAGLCPCSAETCAYGDRQRLPESGPGSPPTAQLTRGPEVPLVLEGVHFS